MTRVDHLTWLGRRLLEPSSLLKSSSELLSEGSGGSSLLHFTQDKLTHKKYSGLNVFISVLIHPLRKMAEAVRMGMEVTSPTGACVGATGAGTAWPLAPGNSSVLSLLPVPQFLLHETQAFGDSEVSYISTHDALRGCLQSDSRTSHFCSVSLH